MQKGRIMRLAHVVVVSGWMIAVAAGCQPKSKAPPPRVSVTVARVTQRDVPFTVSSTGIVEPVATAAVAARVSGTVVRVAFHEGDRVRAGQVLFELDARPLRALYDQALATWAKDRAQVALARAQARRIDLLASQSLTAPADLDQARATLEIWIAAARGDSAAAHGARLALEYATVRAPIAGHTGALLVHEGDYVQAAGAQPLVTINRTAPVRVRFTVPASMLSQIQRYRHGAVRVYIAPPGDSARLAGPLVFVDNMVDEKSGTLLLKGEFANANGALLPGEFVDVRVELFVKPHATVVPAVAVTSGQLGSFVYVVQADSTVTPRPVRVSRIIDSLAVLLDGVRPGESIVTDGQLRLSPGAKIIVRRPAGSSAHGVGQRGR